MSGLSGSAAELFVPTPSCANVRASLIKHAGKPRYL
jgi:hypothetical protein